MAQIARPDEDIAVAGWTPTPVSPVTLFDKVDEAVADDNDYISSPVAPTGDEVVLGLQTFVDPGSSVDHIVRYRIRKNQAGGAQINATARLLQTTTQIATWGHTNKDEVWTTFEQTLSAGEADAITDYAALRFGLAGTQI